MYYGYYYVCNNLLSVLYIFIGNPDQDLSETDLEAENYVVNFGFLISPVVYSLGAARDCHIVTPNGEDLTVLQESKYPNVTRIMTSDTYDCNIQLGPIHKNMLGNWVLYVENIYSEMIKRPFRLHLYGKF